MFQYYGASLLGRWAGIYNCRTFFRTISLIWKMHDKSAKLILVKGGMLVAAMVGLDARATMDLDAAIKCANVTLNDVEKIIHEIISVPLEDGVNFRIKKIAEIMEEADYPGVRVSMETKFDGVITPLKIDISTGDVITPKEVQYSFKRMLEDQSIDIWAYNLETILAEKLETIIIRTVTNTRMRDFYDIHILQEIHGTSLSPETFHTALQATAKKRGTLELLRDGAEVLEEVESSPLMEKLWGAYQKKFSYATDLSWHIVMKSIKKLSVLGG